MGVFRLFRYKDDGEYDEVKKSAPAFARSRSGTT